jgi:RNA polymerase sigma-70 factor (ECF subfamily)
MSGPFDEAAVGAELLGRLLDEHGSALALYAAQWSDAAEDCVQEAFVELARQRVLPEHVVPWLYRVVKHRALNASRGARRRREREARSTADRFVVSHQQATYDRSDMLAVVEALEQLEADEREVVVMRIWSGLTYQEIAVALSISTSTAQRQFEQALGRLRQLLESPCSRKRTPKSHR